jgi:uncharacterized delta-60 repeat protein
MTRRILLSLLLVLALAGVGLAAGTAGLVHTGFGTDGVVVHTAKAENGDSTVWQVLAQPDGKIVAVGTGGSGIYFEGRESYDWQIRRLLADGSLDTSFGTNGLVRFFGNAPGSAAQARAALLDGQGRIWVAGRGLFQNGTTGKGKNQRPAYGGGGHVLRLVPLSDGDVLVVGEGPVETAGSGSGGKGKKNGGGGSTSSQGVVIARLDADGTLDTAYGDAGFARADLNPDSNDDTPQLQGARLQSDGSLVVLTDFVGYGGTGPTVGLVRFSSDGARDTTFADPLPDINLRSMTVDVQDRILVAGYYGGDVYVQRYDPDGALDTSYGVAGEVIFDTSADAFQTEPLGGRALHFDGSDLLVACVEWVEESAPIDGFHSFAIRVDADGDLVSAYGPDGSGQSERLLAMPARDGVIMPNGDLVFGGVSYASDSLGDWALGRLCGN